jgi:hypothetical protein
VVSTDEISVLCIPIFLDIQSCELQCTAALYRPHAILGGTVLVPIIKQMDDLRRGHDAMRPSVSHLMRFPPFGVLLSLPLPRFASGPNGLPAVQYFSRCWLNMGSPRHQAVPQSVYVLYVAFSSCDPSSDACLLSLFISSNRASISVLSALSQSSCLQPRGTCFTVSSEKC